MSDGALDLSVSSYDPSGQRSSRSHDQLSSDSGRASTDSTSSETTHDDVKSRVMMTSPHVAAPSGIPAASAPVGGLHIVPPGLAGLSHTADYPPNVHLRDLPSMPPARVSQHQHQQHPRSVSSSSSPPPPRMNIPSGGGGGGVMGGGGGGGAFGGGSLSHPNSPEAAAASLIPDEDEFKPVLPPLSSSLSSSVERIPSSSDARVAPIRPFKMYPVDPFNVYSSSPMIPGSSGGLSPSQVGMQSIYDTAASPSSFPSFSLTPLTSRLLQRKRRMENRDQSNISGVGSGGSGSVGGGNISSCTASSIAVSNISSITSSGMNIGTVSTSSVPSSPLDDSDGDDEKKAKLMPDERKDDAYWDRRRKNNEAAKRSRDARRQKEEEIAMRAAFLEQENLKLRAQVAILKNETAKLHYMLYNRI